MRYRGDFIYLLTPEQEKTLEEMRKNNSVIWHQGKKDVKDAVIEFVIMQLSSKHNIRAIRKNKNTSSL